MSAAQSATLQAMQEKRRQLDASRETGDRAGVVTAAADLAKLGGASAGGGSDGGGEMPLDEPARRKLASSAAMGSTLGARSLLG